MLASMPPMASALAQRRPLQVGADHRHPRSAQPAHPGRQAPHPVDGQQGQRQPKVDPTPTSLRTLTWPPISATRSMDDRQPEARAAVAPAGGVVGLAEGVEDPPDGIGIDADVAVAHRQAHAGRRPRRRARTGCAPPRSVNLTALLMRLLRIWRIRCGSPRNRSGIAGAMSTDSLEALLRAAGANTAAVCSMVSRRLKGTASSQWLPASIREKSRDVVEQMEQGRGRRTLVGEEIPLTGIQRAGVEQLGDADDAVHRGADLVTHVGQNWLWPGWRVSAASARRSSAVRVDGLLEAFPVGGDGWSAAVARRAWC